MYKLNNKTIRQPDSQLELSFETKYSEDSNRVITGEAVVTPLFTVESYAYRATGVTISEMSEILQIIAKGHPYDLTYFSPYYGAWRTDKFYTGKGSLIIGQLDVGGVYDSLSFNMVGVNPID